MASGSGLAAGSSSHRGIPQVTQMPLPPRALYSLYTDENVRNGRAPKPPSPPSENTTYDMFGATFHAKDALIRPLEDQGLRRLHPQSFDHRQQLKKLNHSTFTSFLDLIDVFILNTGSALRQEKLDDLGLLFIHMHHLINEFRPQQAREALRVMLDIQKRETLKTCCKLEAHLEKCVDAIKVGLNDLSEEWDSDELLASTAEYLTKKSKSAVTIEDQMMCDIVDVIPVDDNVDLANIDG